MKRFKPICLLMIVVSIFLMICPNTIHATERVPAPSILIIHSYNIDYPWTFNLHKAFLKMLENHGVVPNISVEFIDAKKFPKGVDYKTFAELLRLKYQNRKFDLIYITDNDALNLINDYGEKIFPKIPVVASGININTDLKKVRSGIHIVLENVQYDKTIEMILKTTPNIKTLHIVNDLSTTGKFFKEEIQNYLNKYHSRLQVKWVEDLSIAELNTYTGNLTSSDGLMITIYFTNGKSESYQYDEAAKAIVSSSSVPLWYIADFLNESGAIGGRLVTADGQGRKSAEIALRILAHQTAPALVDEPNSINATIIDYNQVRKFGMKRSMFPKDTHFLNEPSFFEGVSRTALLIFGGTVLFLVLIIIVLAFLIHYQRIIRKQDQEYLKLKNENIEEQKEMVFRLGDLIETRSKETGNHVKRLSLLSRYIGEKIGLDEEEIVELESAVPMHDVGKIGIPESILCKPGPLTTEEREIMKTHTTLGYQLFENAELPIFKTSAIVSLQHHENWNGMGYPRGLKGEEIHLFARITTIIDVVDALLSERVYKKPWSEESVREFLMEERGKMFDPEITDIVLEGFDEIQKIRKSHED